MNRYYSSSPYQYNEPFQRAYVQTFPNTYTSSIGPAEQKYYDDYDYEFVPEWTVTKTKNRDYRRHGSRKKKKRKTIKRNTIKRNIKKLRDRLANKILDLPPTEKRTHRSLLKAITASQIEQERTRRKER
jgi:hypothetical protein